MSPEALRGEPVDGRSDIWSLGVMLYQMASGRPPFEGKSPFDLTAALLREPLPTEAPPALRPILEHCLAREAGERYQRAGEVRAALEAIGSASQAMPAAAPPVSRRRWLWGIGGAAALGAAAVVGVVRWRQPRRYAAIPSKLAEANEYFQRAMLVLNAQQDLPLVRQLLEKALELDPKFAHARAWYGFTHSMLIDTGQSNDTTWLYKAEAELRRALADDPNSARAHAGLAAVYLYQGRKELVPQEVEKIVELDPQEREGYMMMALYHQWNGEYEQSQTLLKRVLEADPVFIPARWNVADNLRQMGNLEAAIREIKRVA
jgi:Tfp pilus assembly protein PilF